ncbi:glycosyltransferase family protein [Ideonella livida]|uniref:Glycosyltransferase family 1 protein n=1 Tax=Ideonella livida TaxID=2707176 RepID=A0A7C9PF77_9BURK|nr:glycosyltransferase [Ideonella livida]NDY89912.1 glycosyltransferase family 1 protein [Ideonella livida]
MTAPTKEFLLLSFDHPQQAVSSVAGRMAAGLTCLGLNARVLHLPADAAELARLGSEQVAGILSLGPLPLATRVEGEVLWRRFKVPVSVYLLDAVLYDLARVPVMRDFLADAVADGRLGLISPEAGYREWLAEAVPVRWQHLPFGAFPALGALAEPVAPQQRLCVVGHVGNELGGGQAGESLEALLQRTLQHFTDATARARVAEALRAPHAHAMPARTVADALCWSPREVLVRDRLAALVAIDSWVKRERRLQAVESLRELPVDFFGTGWDRLLPAGPHWRHVGQIAHGDIARLLPHYQALVNFDPNWAHGVHDRVYTAAAMGCPVLTNHNSGLDAAGLPESLVWRYDANRPDLATLVEEAGWLHRPALARSPGEAVLARHNWASRMIEWVQAEDSHVPADADQQEAASQRLRLGAPTLKVVTGAGAPTPAWRAPRLPRGVSTAVCPV